MKKNLFIILVLLLAFFTFNVCQAQNAKIKMKSQNEQFFDISFMLKGLNYHFESPRRISEAAGWIKVGHTYTFRTVNYKDLLASPPMWVKTHLFVTFNGDRTVTIRCMGPGKKIKVDSFTISSPTFDMFDESSFFYEIRIFLNNNTSLHMYKASRNNRHAKNVYGVRFSSESFIFCTGTPSDDLIWANPFDY